MTNMQIQLRAFYDIDISADINIGTVFAFLKTDSARVYEYCKYGPESPSKEIDLSKS